LAVFFVSGLVSLVYQVVWSRLFLPVFGTTLPAVTIVIATFMGGLGLGAHLFGRFVDRASPWRTYALLELGIAAFGLLVPRLVEPLGVVFARLAPIGTPAVVVQLVRLAGVAALLLGPCMLMGGTFSAFVRGFSRARSRLGSDLGAAYAANTLGAACGALLAGIWLVPDFSLRGISGAAAIVNAALAVAVWALNPQASPRVEPDAVPSAPGSRAAWAPLALLFITGYLGMSFELLWTRALSQVLGASIFSFSLALAAMLLGLGAGSALFRRWLAPRESGRLVFPLTALLLLAALSSFLLVGHLPALYRALRLLLPRHAMAPIALSLIAFWPTAVIFGALFPLCLRRCAQHGAPLGRGLGVAYAINTAGAVLGVVITGLVSIELLGSGGTLPVLFLLATAGLAVAAFASEPRPPRGVAIATTAVALLTAFAFPRDVFFANQLASIRASGSPDAVALFRGEDSASIATLVELPAAPFRYVDGGVVRQGKQREIHHSNGRVVGGTDIYLWNVVGGYLAALLHPDPKDILVIGYGSGRQLKTLEGVLGPARIEVAEVNPVNFAASDLFYLDSRAVLSDSRLHVYDEDGRNYLLRSRRQYDVIVVDVGGIGTDGGELLYTREFLRLCRDRLRDGGLIFTWMHLQTLRDPLGVAYQRTLLEVFPASSIWLGTGEPSSYGWTWLVGSKGAPSVDMARLRQRWAALNASQRAELALSGVGSATDLVALHLAALIEPPAELGPGRVLTDDHPGLMRIGRRGVFGRASPEFKQISTRFWRAAVEADPGPRLLHASDDEVAAIRARRTALRQMVKED
jgi:spermidine synthase